MVKLKKLFALALFLIASFCGQAQDAEEAWANIELDAGILGLSSYLGNSNGNEALYRPGKVGSLVNFQISRIKANKWGMWLGVVGSTNTNVESAENYWISEVRKNHPNAFITTANTDNISNNIIFSRTHFMLGVLRRKSLGSIHLNYGLGAGAVSLEGLSEIQIKAKELGNNEFTEYNYDFGRYDTWSWSANAYADLDVKLYRSGKLQWMAFFRTSLMLHGQNGEVLENVEPIIAPSRTNILSDSGLAYHLDMNFGIRLRLVNIQKWKMFQ